MGETQADEAEGRGIWELLLPMLLFLLLAIGLGAAPLRHWLDRYRPPSWLIGTYPLVERQLLHAEVEAERPAPARSRVLFVGSSSVVNGIDVGQIRADWRAIALEPVNLGQTALLAYELPLLRRLLLTPATAAVVYLYNPFSFADDFHPQAIGVRWDTAAAIDLYRAGCRAFGAEDIGILASGAAGEALFGLRNRHLLRAMIGLGATLRLAPASYDYDYPPESPGQLAAPMVPPSRPAPGTHWLRAAYLASAAPGETLGSCALRRFAAMAKARGVGLVLGPMPESDLADLGPYRRGVDVAATHARVAALAGELGLPLLSHADTAALEADRSKFRDEVHLNAVGREIYSRYLAARVPALIARR